MGDPKGDWAPTRDPKRNEEIRRETEAGKKAEITREVEAERAYEERLRLFTERRKAEEKLQKEAESRRIAADGNLKSATAVAEALAKNPLPKDARTADLIAKWIESAVPPASSGTQSPDVTHTVQWHIVMDAGLGLERAPLVWAAMVKTGYKWTLTTAREGSFGRSFALSAGLLKDQQQRQSAGGSKPLDASFARLKAAELNTLYIANQHNPELQAKLQQELEWLLMALDDPARGDMPGQLHAPDDPWPGRLQMQDYRERLAKLRDDILRGPARDVGAHLLRLGPLALDRLQRAPRPDSRIHRAPVGRAPARTMR